MQAEHRIDDLIVDLSFTTTRLARHEKAVLVDWLSDDLLPALDQLFSQISPGKNILRFETLEFDFGNLGSRYYQQQICEQLLAQLTQLLTSQLIALSPTNSAVPPSTNDIQHSQTALIQIIEYLATGQIRAHRETEKPANQLASKQQRLAVEQSAAQLEIVNNHGVGNQDNALPQSSAPVKKPAITASGIHEQLLEHVLTQHNIAELLRQFPDHKILAERLLKQFSERQRLELLRQLIPQHMETIVALLDLLQFAKNNFLVNDSTYSVAVNSIDSDYLYSTLWKQLIIAGLEDSSFTESMWLDAIICNFSTALAIPKLQIQEYLTAIQLPVTASANSLIKLQAQIAQGTGTAFRNGAIGSSLSNDIVDDNSFDISQQQKPDYLRQLIATAFIRGDASQLQKVWLQLITRDSQLLLAALKYYLPQAEIRQQLMMSFPLTMQAGIITFLAPSLESIFLKLQNKASQLIDAMQLYSNKIQSNAGDLSSELLQRRLWEIAVGLVLKDVSENSKMDTQNTDTFLTALATTYAELNSINTQSLQQIWFAIIHDRQAPLYADTATILNSDQEWGNSVDNNSSEVITQEQVLTVEVDKQPVSSLATIVVGSSVSNDIIDNSPFDIPQQQNPDYLHQLIAAAFIRGDASQLQKVWPQLLTNEPQLLLAALTYYLPQAEIRQQLMMNFPLTMQANIIALLASSLESTFFLLQNKASQLIDAIQVYSNGISSGPSNASDSSSELLQRRLWEIAVGLILKDAPENSKMDTRNTSTFLSTLTTTYAQLNSINTQSLQQIWFAVIHDQQVPFYVDTAPIINRDQEWGNSSEAITQQQELTRKAEEQFVGQNDEYDLTGINNEDVLLSNSLRGEQTVNSLATISDHQLFDLCLRLKSGALPWSQLPLDIELLRRLINSYIRLGHSATTENCADFVAAIDTQAALTHASAIFYTEVLQTLIADKLVDLEAIGLDVQNKQHKSAGQKTTQTQNNNRITESQKKQLLTPTDNIQLEIIAAQLKEGKVLPESLGLNQDQLIRLLGIYIDLDNTLAEDMQADFIAAIHQHASEVNHRDNYYLQVLRCLVNKEIVDLGAICDQLNNPHQSAQLLPSQLPISTSQALAVEIPSTKVSAIGTTSLLIDQVPADQPSTKSSPVNLSSAISVASHTKTVPLAEHELTLSKTLQVPSSTLTGAKKIVQSLLADPQPLPRLQQLILGNAQWQVLVGELIQQMQMATPDSASELTHAIQFFARRATNTSIYYRLVIKALLKQQPIDLEAFVVATTDINHSMINNDKPMNADLAKNDSIKTDSLPALFEMVATDVANQNSEPIYSMGDADNHVDQIVSKQFKPELFKSEKFNSEQAINYSLSTGSDNLLRKPAISLAQLFAAEQPLGQEQLVALQQHVNHLLNRANQILIAEWCQLLADEKHSHILISAVPAHLLHKIAMRLQADRYTWLDSIVKTVIEALALLVTDINSLAIKQAKWKFIFNYLFSENNTSKKPTENNERAMEVSITLCEQLAAALGIDDVSRLINLTQRRIALLKPPTQKKPSMRLQDITTISPTQNDASTPQWEAGLHINNAGQVLAAAFLPRLFSMLNLMSDGKFTDLGAADRAVHLLQFIVNGQSTTPEYELVLNKILCGVGTSIPVSAGIEITEQEQTLIEQMLTSMIQHWKVLGSTSIAGLRETFFQRQGWLVLEEDCWRLKVREQTFDLLLDRLPWSISLIKHGWMDKPLRVSWRDQS